MPASAPNGMVWFACAIDSVPLAVVAVVIVGWPVPSVATPDVFGVATARVAVTGIDQTYSGASVIVKSAVL